MAEKNPNVPQVDNPELEADLIRELRIIGRLGKLNVADLVLPVISLGSVVEQTVEVRNPVYSSTTVFSEGVQTAPAAGALLADTGQVIGGVFDIMLYGSSDDFGSVSRFIEVEHRNAANSATLATWAHAVNNLTTAKVVSKFGPYSFSYEIAENERLRMLVGANASAGSHWNAVIFAVRRG